MKYSNSCNILSSHETGILEIRVIDNRNIPISNAYISIAKISYTGIYNEGAEGLVIAEFHTDDSGIIQKELPVLNELIGRNEYYSARISKEGYYEVFIFYIQIYPNINSSYDVYLNPWTYGAERYKFIFQPKRRTVHEH